jgi:hypothetical protein
MTLLDLQDQLRAHIRARIGRGELTGTMLARNAEFPQGHLSNFLNSRRGLSLESMDRLLDALGISILDLMDSRDAGGRGQARPKRENVQSVAMVSAQNATLARFRDDQVLETRNFKTTFLRKLKAHVAVDRRDWLRFILIKLDVRGAVSMIPATATTLLIDRHYSSLQPYRRLYPNLYLASVAGRCVAAYISVCDNCLVLQQNALQPEIEIVRLERGQTYCDYIVGRVCHVGLEC